MRVVILGECVTIYLRSQIGDGLNIEGSSFNLKNMFSYMVGIS